MTLSRCPKCNDEVRIPVEVSPQATLKCPLCGESYEAATILTTLPPMLEVVHDPAPPTLPAVAAHHDSSGFQGIEVDTESAHDHVGEQVPAFEFDESEAPQRDAPTFTQDETSRPVRRRRPQRSPAPQIVGILLGGLASIPLAQLCLWWIFGTDPVDMGPSVGRYVPFVVPAKFREVAKLDRENAEDNDRPSEQSKTSRRDGADDGRRTLLSSDDPTPFDASDNSAKTPGGVPSRPESSDDKNDQKAPSRPPDSAPGKFSSGQSPNAPTDSAGAGVLGPGIKLEEPDPRYVNLADPTPALRSRQATTTAQVYERLQAVMDGYENWNSENSTTSADRAQQLDDFYDALCMLGESLLYVDPADPQAVQAANTVHASLEVPFQQPSLRQFVGNRATRRLAESIDTADEGIALAGSVAAIQRVDDLLVTEIRLTDSLRTVVEVYGWRPPPKSLKVGAKVFVLGARIKNPHEVLPIQGTPDEVVAGAYLFVQAEADE